LRNIHQAVWIHGARKDIQMKTRNEEDRNAIKAGIDAWINAVEGRDIALLPRVIAQDEDLVWIGIDAGGWMVGFKTLEQGMLAQNAALEEIRIDVSDETIHFEPGASIAWATNRWVFNGKMGGQAMAFNLRCTWILEKRQGKWIIVHFHKSVGQEM
jgi:ketosteroid isomerase-like protein